MTTPIDIPLERLRPRPDNANRMSPAAFAKLTRHLARTGRYPAVIARPHPSEAGAYEILDGHHRVEALRALGRDAARCDVWEVDDDEALVLLATLNRLQGQDDPARRGALLEELSRRLGRERLPELLPESENAIARLLRVATPPPPPAIAPRLDALPEAVTFFLTPPQRRALEQRLDEHEGATRSQRLVALLGLDSKPGSWSGPGSGVHASPAFQGAVRRGGSAAADGSLNMNASVSANREMTHEGRMTPR